MKRTIIIGTVIIGLVLFAAVAFAYPRFGGYGGCGGVYQPEMQQIIVSGTYAELEAFREKVGFNVMPWVTDEETFKAMQESHKAMFQARQNGYGMMGWRAWR